MPKKKHEAEEVPSKAEMDKEAHELQPEAEPGPEKVEAAQPSEAEEGEKARPLPKKMKADLEKHPKFAKFKTGVK